MKIIENITKLQDFLKEIRKKGKKIGLIPTMGSIHKGHLSLIQNCQKLGYFSLITIFVNPTQFNNLSDFKMYPRNCNIDKKSLQNIKADLLFYPKTKDLYPMGIKSQKTIFDYRNILCDIYRPGHFDGVTTVVDSLFNLIKPEHVFFGEKDFQQLKLIQKIIENNKSSIIVHQCPSIRMPNGMSYSSRYKKFTMSEEKIFMNIANILMRIINDLRKNLDPQIIDNLRYELEKAGLEKIDYLEIRDEIKLLSTLKKNNARLFIAVYIENTRLIDNIKL